MDIEITQTCGVHGEVVEEGEIVEVDDATAKLLIGIGKAKPSIQTREPQIQHSDPSATHGDPGAEA
jgi:hypothetical protein